MDNRIHFKGLKNRTPEECFEGVNTPCYILDTDILKKNGEKLFEVSKRAGCKLLLAQKAFSNYEMYPALRPYLAGTEASGLYEARLGKEEMPGKEVHVFSAAYKEEEFNELLKWADHIVFNSPNQLKKYGKRAKEAGKSIGLRINPECSTQEGHEIYDPCAAGSRLGTTREVFDKLMDEEMLSMLDGIHFHTLCEQNSDDLKKTLFAVEEKFGDIISKVKWLNMGGGHHITREDYDTDTLVECVLMAKSKWNVEVYLEPGEAWALNAGYLATKVLDVFKNGETNVAILDVSAACHMPDVIEMPYRPPLYGGGEPDERAILYRFGGPTCLAGDIIGEYSFDKELKEGDMLLFGDMAIYSICKNNTFNGMALPSIYEWGEEGCRLIKEFGYCHFKERL